ncbi:uncharacterized protein LOC114181572 isoform X4 [Vigna unguiculata]|uniref:uncharacterized protein LOC114181572 isoform X4 n=1 Tax=Vigna unguiculata TaxID=3917 RepID=UPI001016CEE3|nr:uncharacterized protein LOC114181572 isoform X4 [Vigna unguiculata]
MNMCGCLAKYCEGMVDFISAYFHWNEILSRLLLVQRTFLQRKLKRYIKDENSRYAKGVKEAKLKIDATKEKVKCLERKLWNEKAKVVSSTVSPFPMEEKIRTEVDEAHADMLRLKSTKFMSSFL